MILINSLHSENHVPFLYLALFFSKFYFFLNFCFIINLKKKKNPNWKYETKNKKDSFVSKLLLMQS